MEVNVNYEDRDAYGIYKGGISSAGGPDMRTGRVSYAVMSFGGFLGMGEKLFAVPWSMLVLDTKNRRFVLNVEKDRLTTAPGFDKGKWPDMADPSWAKGIHDYYGAKQYTEELH